jgi:outer membrane protein OmpA-like peptidoglycan-associated protein
LRRDPKRPLQIQEARNAVQIARWTGAERYAADTFQKALVDLQNAEDYLRGKGKGSKPLETVAREATQMAEDARIITIRKMEEERLANERAAAAEREARAKAAADAEAHRRAEAEAARARAEAATAEEARLRAKEQAAASQQLEEQRKTLEQQRLAAEQAKQQAEAAAQQAAAAAAQAAKEKAEADAARAAALQQQQQLQAEAERSRLAASEADRARQAAEADKEQMRLRLLQQLNLILETRDSARGLIVNMSDVLFDFNKWTLKPGAREKLSKISGIVLAYPGLRLEVEGHTDSVGSDEYNQTLSEKRAFAVRDYLVQQGINGNSVTARGFGKVNPVASNDSAAGRQRNRRVELVVSGEVIGTQIGPVRTTPGAQTLPPR